MPIEKLDGIEIANQTIVSSFQVARSLEMAKSF